MIRLYHPNVRTVSPKSLSHKLFVTQTSDNYGDDRLKSLVWKALIFLPYPFAESFLQYSRIKVQVRDYQSIYCILRYNDNAKYDLFRHTTTVSSVGEIHSVDCCWTTKINSPPRIGFCRRMRTYAYTAMASIRFMIAVIGKMSAPTAVTIADHTALISWFVQRGVVGYHKWVCCTTHHS